MVEKLSLNGYDFWLGNAAGGVRSLAELKELIRVARPYVTDLTIGSYTPLPRTGHSGDTFYYDVRRRAAVNSRGMPNRGFEWLMQHLHEFMAVAKAAGKRLRISIAAFTIDDYVTMAYRIFESLGSASEWVIVEFNLSCPNIVPNDRRKGHIISRNHAAVGELCVRSKRALGEAIAQCAAKISPVERENEHELVLLCTGVSEAGFGELVTCNTVPNCTLTREDGSPALSWRDGDGSVGHAGGGSGALCHDVNLQIAAMCSAFLGEKTKVIGVGGVDSYMSLLRYLMAGASGVQVGAAWMQYPDIFRVIMEEAVMAA